MSNSKRYAIDELHEKHPMELYGLNIVQVKTMRLAAGFRTLSVTLSRALMFQSLGSWYSTIQEADLAGLGAIIHLRDIAYERPNPPRIRCKR